MNDLGQKIKELRMDKGLTMEEFGKLFDASKSIVSRWERDISVPNEKRLKRIAKLAGKSVSEFVYGVPSAKTIQQLIEYLEERKKEFHAHEYSDDSIYSGFLGGHVHILNKIKEWENG